MRGIISVVTFLLLIASAFADVDVYIRAAFERKEIPHAVVLIEQNGKIVYERAAGANRDDVYALASTSKPIAATAIMTLVEQGRLSLDERVAKYLPAFEHSSTIRQLLSHTSGIFGNNAPGEQMRMIRNPNQLLSESVDRIVKTPLAYEPGARYQYGGASFCVAGRIAEIVSGTPFDQFAKRTVFDPAGMTTAQYKGRFVLVPGGVESNAADLLQFARAYPRLLNEKSRAEMTRKQTGTLAANYGIGWQLLEDGAFGHGGAFGTYLYIHPGKRLTAVIMTHVEKGSPFAREILKRLPK